MYELDKTKFGSFVAQLRKDMGYTQKQLSEKLLISDKAISKWETGTTMPDTALLIPLADILGVSVTELLTGERIEKQALPSDTVEHMIKTVITYADTSPKRAWQEKTFWQTIFLCTCLVNAAFLLLLRQIDHLTSASITHSIFCICLGAYFCFFVPLQLPAYYDQNKISGIIDGVVSMHLLNLHFNNKNWMHIVKTARLSMIVNMIIFPLLSIIFWKLAPELWSACEHIILLMMLLGGLFLPVYIVGKKYE